MRFAVEPQMEGRDSTSYLFRRATIWMVAPLRETAATMLSSRAIGAVAMKNTHAFFRVAASISPHPLEPETWNELNRAFRGIFVKRLATLWIHPNGFCRSEK